MIKVKLNETNVKVMAELAVKGLRKEFDEINITSATDKNLINKHYKTFNKRKSALIDCLERLEMHDLIREIE